MPRTDAFVLVTTVVTVVLTHDLAKGVFAGVLLSAVFFVRKLARQIQVVPEDSKEGEHRVYHVYGSLFFVAVDNFLAGFDYETVPKCITLDFSRASLWDSSAIGAIDKVVRKLRKKGATVDVVPPENEGRELIRRLAIFDRGGETDASH